MAFTDRELGLGRPIHRRDFLNGVALAIGTAAAPRLLIPDRALAATPYPPALTGLRGQHPGSFEAMHAIRDGDRSAFAAPARETGETYDLVVVGAGISGLAAAFEYRERNGPNSRILILDNHDDFGGHAKRNEFTASNGSLVIGYGGSQSLQTPILLFASRAADAGEARRRNVALRGILRFRMVREAWSWRRILHRRKFRRGPAGAPLGDRFGVDRRDSAQRKGQGRPRRPARRAGGLSA